MNERICYFAFGSNMHRYRLYQRIGEFEPLGIACLADHQLVFHKCGGDGSGKCTVVSHPNTKVWGTLSGITQEQKQALDYYEGVGHGYSAVFFDVEHRESSVNALLYQAELDAMDDGLLPFNWYKDFVLSGAMQHELPADYIRTIELIRCIDDPDEQRVRENRRILNSGLLDKCP